MLWATLMGAHIFAWYRIEGKKEDQRRFDKQRKRPEKAHSVCSGAQAWRSWQCVCLVVVLKNQFVRLLSKGALQSSLDWGGRGGGERSDCRWALPLTNANSSSHYSQLLPSALFLASTNNNPSSYKLVQSHPLLFLFLMYIPPPPVFQMHPDGQTDQS